jgi:hypothetical protein
MPIPVSATEMVTQSRLKTTILDVRIDRVCSVDDAGVAINPLTLDGQLHGSLAQAVGEMLMESVIYERGTGQLLTGSFMDYAMPRADIMPAITTGHAPVPTKVNLLGTKGGSEAGNAGGPAAIINAVLDALSPLPGPDLHRLIAPASLAPSVTRSPHRRAAGVPAGWKDPAPSRSSC